MPQPAHSRRSVSRAAVAVGAVMSLVASASPATAAEAPTVVIPTIVIPTINGTTSEHWEYQNTVIDPGATSLRIDAYVRAGGATVDCTLHGSESPLITATFTAEEWNASGPVEMDLPDGTLSEGVSSLDCASGTSSQWSILWHLETGEGGTDLIDQDDSRLLYYVNDRTFESGPSHEIAPGATVLLAGPWEYGVSEEDGFSRASLTSSDPRFASIDLPVAYQESGEYGLLVQIPSGLPAGFTDAPATLAAESGSYSGAGDHLRNTSWAGPVVFGVAEPSSTFLALERRFGTSRERLTASAVVTTEDGPVGAGTIDFFLNSKRAGSATVDEHGRASILLPKLPRGKHFVVATFRGTDAVKSSSSGALSVRILI